MRYEVIITGSDKKTIVNADNAQQAKHKACKHWNIKPSDKWCGVSGMRAIRIIQE
jgi:hypothetical protein